MSEVRELMKNLVASAKTGNEAAIKLLRDVCSRAPNAAPVEDLITIAEFYIRLNADIDRRQAERN